MFHSIIEAMDLDGRTPLDYAQLLGQANSARLLLDAGAIIDLEDTKTIENVPVTGWNAAQKDDIIALLAGELAARRKQLMHFAITRLTEKDITNFHLRERAMLQECALEVVELLRSQHVNIPACFHTVRPGSIYHTLFMSATLAEALFNVGFDNTNIALDGFTPLMMIGLGWLTHRRGLEATLDLVAWFEEHGADIHTQIPVTAIQTTTASTEPVMPRFEVIHRIGFAVGAGCYRTHILESDWRRISQLRRLIGDESTDSCDCYCARGGCTPAALFARGMFSSYRNSGWNPKWPLLQGMNSQKSGRSALESTIRGGLELLDSITREGECPPITETIVRVSTFDRLGMIHTCCSYTEDRSWYDDNELAQKIRDGKYQLVEVMDPADIDEIREEDRHLAVLLESLMEEFVAKLRQRDLLFSEFFYEYWWGRMDEIEQEREEILDSDRQAMRDIGVILDE